MNKHIKNKVTICLVNYKTEELTRLCLRSIRKFTNYPYEVIVVDNNSNDKSLDYLRTLKWIKLIERPGYVGSSGSVAHGSALDMGLKAANTEYFLAMHSDTFIHKKGWLEWLVNQINITDNTACTGSGKLELKPRWKVLLKQATDFKLWIRKMTTDNPNKLKFYIRAICALYKTEILKKENLTFSLDVPRGMTCAKQMYFELLERNYNTNIISDFKMAEMVYHLAHATMVFNPEFELKSRTEKKCKIKLEKILSSPAVQEVLADTSLDN
jgi:glycosyltransferase involved in cell wall biosynthesis